MPGSTFMIIGAAGGLGSVVLSHLRATLSDEDVLIAASSSASKFETTFAAQGFVVDNSPDHQSPTTNTGPKLLFRVANYDSDTPTLAASFKGVDKLLFVSSNTFDNAKRNKQHARVVAAIKEAGVGHTYYTSLAFGGLSDDSKVSVQAAHLETERLLASSGVKYTSVREGLYADAFPLFVDWFPDSEEVVVPAPGTGGMALALRAELGEATANVMRLGAWDGEKRILLSGSEALEMREMVDVVNEVRVPQGKDAVRFTVLPDGEAYVETRLAGLGSGKGEAFFRSRLTWFEGLVKGEGAVITDTLEKALGRKPTGGREAIRRLLEGVPGGDYTWHQNEVGK